MEKRWKKVQGNLHSGFLEKRFWKIFFVKN